MPNYDNTGIYQILSSSPVVVSTPGAPGQMTPEQYAQYLEQQRRAEEQARARALAAGQQGAPPVPASAGPNAAEGSGGSGKGCWGKGGGGGSGSGSSSDKKAEERKKFYDNLNKQAGQSAVPTEAIGGPGTWITTVLLALAPRRKRKRRT